jgi:hypothetical protein
MPFAGKYMWTLTLALVAVLTVAPAEAQGGAVAGRAWLVGADGTEIPGEYLRVYLVTAPLEIPQVDLAAGLAPLERQSRLNSGHKTLFLRFREKMAAPGYLVDNTLSGQGGDFGFPAVAPGRYWLVVVFPAMIRGEKVAWQVPVEVAVGRTAAVALNAANLALPCR